MVGHSALGRRPIWREHTGPLDVRGIKGCLQLAGAYAL